MAKSYRDKLLDPRWQKKRLEILERDNFTCFWCKDTTETLHVHHREYIKGKEPWDYIDGNFLTLCKFCHVFEEKYFNLFGSNWTEMVKSNKISDSKQIYIIKISPLISDSSILQFIEIDTDNFSIRELFTTPFDGIEKLLAKMEQSKLFWSTL